MLLIKRQSQDEERGLVSESPGINESLQLSYSFQPHLSNTQALDKDDTAESCATRSVSHQ